MQEDSSEPVIEKERSHSSEERHAGLLVGTWYYLIPDPSGALVSEVVDRKDLALERTHIPGHHFTPTGPTDGHNNESDCAMDDNVFLSRSRDEVYPKHLSPDERVAFEIADSAEWKAIVDSGSVKVLDLEVANTIRKGATRQGDQLSNGEATQASRGHLQETENQVQMVCFGNQDPDAADMFTYAPTPQTESIMMFRFLLQLCSLTLSIADLKNGFSQSDSLDRSAGPLFVEQCEGLDLPSGSLVQLIAPVYGLNDAPLRWHRTLAHQARISKVSAGTLSVRALRSRWKRGRIEFDDLAIGTKRMQEAEFQQRFQGSGRNERPAMLADESDNEITMSWLIKKKTFWRNCTLYFCVRNSRKTESSHWMNSINSVHLCIRSVGLPRRVVPRLQDLRRFWHNT